jgi:hypothetical protein
MTIFLWDGGTEVKVSMIAVLRNLDMATEKSEYANQSPDVRQTTGPRHTETSRIVHN